MRCPGCGKEGLKYIEQRNVKSNKKESKNQMLRRRKSPSSKKDKLPPRTNFNAKCKCGWQGTR